jgi:ATP-dependent 26S proteasome regulatory subunit
MNLNFNTLENLQSKLNQMVSVIYVLTEDEHRAILGIHEISQKSANKFITEVFVYKSTTGFLSINEYKDEIDSKKGVRTNETLEINDALIHVFKQNPTDRRKIFILTEADQHLDDNQIVRRVKDFVIQADNCDENLKILILMSSRLYLPQKLDKYIDIVIYPYPNEEEIKIEIENWLAKFNAVTDKKKKMIEVRTDYEIINSLKGLTIPQIRRAMTACLDITRRQGKSELNPQILNTIKIETLNKSPFLKMKNSSLTFNKIGGLGRIKKWFKTMHGGWTNEGKNFGLETPKGAIMIGLPGCGKTLIMEALANEWGLNYVEFDPSSVYSSRVGESEGNMRMALTIIESLSPVILGIDEIEKGFSGTQSSTFSDAGTVSRTFGIFIIWMQNNQSSVFTSATCNSVQLLPPELISRFDEIFYVGPPNIEERAEIIKIEIDKKNRDTKKFNITKLAEACAYLTGREIMQAIKEAMHIAFNVYHSDINDNIIEQSLKRKTPVIRTMDQQLQYLIKWVGYDDRTKDGVRARFANNEIDEYDQLFREILTANNDSNSSSTNSNLY